LARLLAAKGPLRAAPNRNTFHVIADKGKLCCCEHSFDSCAEVLERLSFPSFLLAALFVDYGFDRDMTYSQGFLQVFCTVYAQCLETQAKLPFRSRKSIISQRSGGKRIERTKERTEMIELVAHIGNFVLSAVSVHMA
jgi:hypothetical protein